MSMYKRFRLEKELSQEEMAQKLKISTNAYRNYESGERLMPTDVLMRFLRIRATDSDMVLADVLEEVCAIRKQ